MTWNDRPSVSETRVSYGKFVHSTFCMSWEWACMTVRQYFVKLTQLPYVHSGQTDGGDRRGQVEVFTGSRRCWDVLPGRRVVESRNG